MRCSVVWGAWAEEEEAIWIISSMAVKSLRRTGAGVRAGGSGSGSGSSCDGSGGFTSNGLASPYGVVLELSCELGNSEKTSLPVGVPTASEGCGAGLSAGLVTWG